MLFLNKRNLGIGVIIGATSLAACALPDYQPPPSGGTSSGAGAAGGDATGSGGMGTGGTGTGGTGTGGAPSSSASTGSGGATEANCLDGLDDDGDGHADCADSDCQAGYECVPAPAQNFSDLLRLRVLGVGNASVECAPGVNPVRRFKDPASSECTACECTTLAQCGPFGVSLSGDSLCSGSQVDLMVPPGGCAPLNPGGVSGAIYVDPPQPLPGACQAGQSVQVTKEKFHTAVDVCQVSGTLGGGCAEGSVCAPRAKPEYAGDGMCVGTTGDVSCPAGFPNRIVAYSGGLDGRTCSPCTCEASKVECLGGGITVDKTNNCSGVPISIELQTCTPIGNVGAQSVKSNPATAVLTEGACGGGAKDGSVQPENPQTFCCAP